MKKFRHVISWACVAWCMFCAFKITQHERDIYKMLFRIEQIKSGYEEVYCK